MAESKKQLINVSRSPVDDVIMEHYEQFKQGIPIALVNQFKPQNWLLKTYKNAMVHKCEEQRIYFNGIRTRIYVLNKDQQSYYDKMINEEDTETSNANNQKYKKTIQDNGFIEQMAYRLMGQNDLSSLVCACQRSGQIEQLSIWDSFWDGTNPWTPLKKAFHYAIHVINEISNEVH
ncbi:MAG: hypothetical protein EZS28_041843 [Streblomastix strix]|uniref:Uncharacterized protein n=1 Tax=Streblomastix strix TaxID=222440 RepID=A0A5J4TX42_9EUKA|nr:MAG: hypothetical protein EZS28_041843 [Streblomastix strix]